MPSEAGMQISCPSGNHPTDRKFLPAYHGKLFVEFDVIFAQRPVGSVKMSVLLLDEVTLSACRVEADFPHEHAC